MTPNAYAHENANVILGNFNGSTVSDVGGLFGIRPVINLKKELLVESGEETKTGIYTIKELNQNIKLHRKLAGVVLCFVDNI